MAIIANSFKEFRDYFEKGYVLAYPTETCFGLGVNPFNKDAFDLLNKVKNRSSGKPYILIVKNIDMLSKYAVIDKHKNFLEKVWPCPLSVCLKATDKLPDWLKDSRGKTCFRVSSAKFVKEVFDYIDRPITSTSANPESFPVASNAFEVISYFSEEKLVAFDDIYLDSNKNLPSTIVDLTLDPPKILRDGAFKIVF